MSREELTHAYLRGGLSRRRFIKRLVAAGVTAGAAVSYANELAASPPKTGRVGRNHYDHYESERPGRGCGDKKHTHEDQEDCGDKPRGPKPGKGPGADVAKGKAPSADTARD